MSLFDLIPTIPEVFDKTICLITGHNWVKSKDGTVFCSECLKVLK